MRFRFIGQYTNGRTSITTHGVTFEGNEPAEVTGEEAIRRLSGNADFEEVHDAEPVAEKPPVRRGRPPKK